MFNNMNDYIDDKNKKYARIIELMAQVDAMNIELNETMNEVATKQLALEYYDFETK